MKGSRLMSIKILPRLLSVLVLGFLWFFSSRVLLGSVWFFGSPGSPASVWFSWLSGRGGGEGGREEGKGDGGWGAHTKPF